MLLALSHFNFRIQTWTRYKRYGKHRYINMASNNKSDQWAQLKEVVVEWVNNHPIESIDELFAHYLDHTDIILKSYRVRFFCSYLYFIEIVIKLILLLNLIIILINLIFFIATQVFSLWYPTTSATPRKFYYLIWSK